MENSLENGYKEIYVGEYSPEQGFYNVCSIEEMLVTNNEHMKNGSFSGYIPLCLGTSLEEVEEELDKLHKAYGRPGDWKGNKE